MIVASHYLGAVKRPLKTVPMDLQSETSELYRG